MKIAFVFNQQRDGGIHEAEFDTPETIAAICDGLKGEKNTVVPIEMTPDGSWIKELKQAKPDLIFNTAEGFHGIGRESAAPICFEQLQIPYVGSGPYTCFLTLDKFLTKQMVARHGVPVPDGIIVTNIKEFHAAANELLYPVFIKPNYEGSSKGITSESFCRTKEEAVQYTTKLLAEFPDGVLIERYIKGKDVTVPYIQGLGKDGGVLEPLEYVGPKTQDNWIYDYELKNTRDEEVTVKCPAEIKPRVRQKIIQAMKLAVRALAVQDMARADFRVTDSGEVYFIELNALPSLQPGAGIYAASSMYGLDYKQTIQEILTSAQTRFKIPKHRSSHKMITKVPNVALVYNLKRKSHDDDDYESEAEFDSIDTVNAIEKAVISNGYPVKKIEASPNLAEHLLDEEIDVVFNIAEGASKRAREAQVPAICDLLNIEHTGSDATCLAVTLDKALTNKIMRSEGVKAPRSKVFSRPPKVLRHRLQFPVIVKPNLEGTSKGIYANSVAHNNAELQTAIERLWESNTNSILCEEYIVGREFTIAVLGGHSLQTLGPLEIAFKDKENPYSVYSFDLKQLDEQEDNQHFTMVCPVALEDAVRKRIQRFALKCFRVAGCRDIARIDFRLNKDNVPYFIEINPLPGLSPGFSDLTIMAERLNWSYEKLIGTILRPAVRRWRKRPVSLNKFM